MRRGRATIKPLDLPQGVEIVFGGSCFFRSTNARIGLAPLIQVKARVGKSERVKHIETYWGSGGKSVLCTANAVSEHH